MVNPTSQKRKRPHDQDKDESKLTLRDLPRTPTYFQDAIGNNGQIMDKNINSRERALPGNEIAAMALNEVAAVRGRGFFYYLPTREYWTRPATEPLLPAGRTPQLPGSEYPTLLYMDFVWCSKSQNSFSAETHRGRYLKCNALINPPDDPTPLYPIQYVDNARFPLYITDRTSLVIIAVNGLSFFVNSTAELEKLIGRWDTRKPWKPSGPDPERRLEHVPYLFERAKTGGTLRPDRRVTSLLPYERPDIAAVYDDVVGRCKAFVGDIRATMDVDTMHRIIPRGSQPDGGHGLGTEVANEYAPKDARPRSLRGVPRPRPRTQNFRNDDENDDGNE